MERDWSLNSKRLLSAFFLRIRCSLETRTVILQKQNALMPPLGTTKLGLLPLGKKIAAGRIHFCLEAINVQHSALQETQQ